MGRGWIIFVGDCNQVGEALAKKPATPLWIAVGFLDSFLRTYGQVVFCNNPLTGFMILTALIVANPYAAGVGVVATVVAIFTAWLTDQPCGNVRAGVCSFNALLLGQLSAILLPELEAIDWLFITSGAALSVYFSSAFGTLFQNISKYPLPSFTVPFVVAQILVYMCTMSPAVKSMRSSWSSMDYFENTTLSSFYGGNYSSNWTSDDTETIVSTSSPSVIVNGLEEEYTYEELTRLSFNSSCNEDIDWGEVCCGVLRSMAQVYGQSNLPSSLLMVVAVVVSSPTTAIMGLLGATVSTLVGTLLIEPSCESREAVYLGAWGFNGLLASGGVGGFALVLTPQSAAMALIAALLAAVLQSVLAPTFRAGGVPLTTLPFNLSALLLLCVTMQGSGALVRPPAITYPEKHRRDWVATRQNTQQTQPPPSEIPADEEGKAEERFRKLQVV